MEIEAKYRVEDAALLARLATLTVLGPYQLQRAADEDQLNTYFDSADRRLQHARYGLRQRMIGGRSLITLKGPNSVVDGVHQRDEWEFPSDTPQPAQWPVGEARDRALALLGDSTLVELLTISTQRRILKVMQGTRLVAEIALDDGMISAGTRREPIVELEIELHEEGTADDLAVLSEALGTHITLVPESQSKLERGLTLLDAG
jgi:inorganic triphosphatase YgiF